MTSRTKSYYELLDILPDAKREEIALGYQRALEALAQEHDTDPRRRAALRKASVLDAWKLPKGMSARTSAFELPRTTQRT